jgi:predicted lipoprotein with Yx(FWY)xxD motif
MTHALRTGLMTAAGAAAAATLLAACSSSSKNDGGAGGGTSGGAGSGGAASLATHDVSSVGTVLADASGMTLYTADQEADGTIKCTGACLQIWKPVTGSVSAPSGVTGKIASTSRSDGVTQLTYNGAPLYTFAEDSAAGDAKGNDAKDAFGTEHFTWHAVVITPSTGGASSSSGGGGGGGGYGGGY